MKFHSKNRPALIVFDFDGVMTDNRVLVFQDGTEAVWCSRSDGLGVSMLREAKIPMVILSTEKNPVVTARAKKLRMPVLQGKSDKSRELLKYSRHLRVSLSEIMYVGNDLNDLAAMKIVGWPVCPSDAHSQIKRISKIVLKAKGGDGVVREIAEVILKISFKGQ